MSIKNFSLKVILVFYKLFLQKVMNSHDDGKYQINKFYKDLIRMLIDSLLGVASILSLEGKQVKFLKVEATCMSFILSSLHYNKQHKLLQSYFKEIIDSVCLAELADHKFDEEDEVYFLQVFVDQEGNDVKGLSINILKFMLKNIDGCKGYLLEKCNSLYLQILNS